MSQSCATIPHQCNSVGPVHFYLQYQKDKIVPVCTSFQKARLTASVSKKVLFLDRWFLTQSYRITAKHQVQGFIVSTLTSYWMWCPPKNLSFKPLKAKLWEHGTCFLQLKQVFMKRWLLHTWLQSLNSLFQIMFVEWFFS